MEMSIKNREDKMKSIQREKEELTLEKVNLEINTIEFYNH
jgi:hypothetical protein